MIKKLFYISIISLITESCNSVMHNKVRENPAQTLGDIVIGQGIDPLVINHSLKKDVEKILGNGKEVETQTSFNNHSASIKSVVYSKIGIEVEYSSLDKIRDNDTLKIIKLFKECTLKMSNGIKMGVPRREIESMLGIPDKMIYERLIDGSVYHSIVYKNVEFVFNNSTSINIMDSDLCGILMW